ncbi:DNA-directed RNA polymerase [Orbilia oligospora]|uniref:DNA-directed RNA polymerase n=1 Tax=Orbilia oligospora TaxID=2813651 RepID=A0A7C8NFP2_ORBOL|nr:DNA-directed RNA polymerase [Orbilia oligospora]KAF3097693.1 DNA-directed RNA polymerase [Orbilia oligospora]KAF3100223.1 DNA-directed RNA polymerase [Orbilia oligospora]KAF3130086.1 DNA-directed RNA polymerase [Orbilia oligospora]KAF3137713.1 DNA-directed RNA polymerase [Orbilia oligospora]
MLARRCSRRQFPLRSTIQQYTISRSPRWLPTLTTAPPSRLFSTTGPIYNAYSATPGSSTHSTSSKKADRPTVSSERHYSTSPDLSSIENPQGDFPFYTTAKHDGKASSPEVKASTDEPPPDFSWLRLHDPSSFFKLQTPELPMHARPYETSRGAVDPFKIGTGTHKEDVFTSFVACVKMGRLERAELMLDRLHHDFVACTSIVDVNAIENRDMLANHNIFLRGYLARAKDAIEKLKKPLTSEEEEQGPDGEPVVASNAEDIRDYSIQKIEDWYNDHMVGKYEIEGDDMTFAILLEAVTLSNRSPRDKKQEIGNLIFKWERRKDVLLGDILRHMPLSAIDAVKMAHKITQNDLHPEQYSILTGYTKPEIEEVLETQVKGSSLAAVKQSLQSFADHSVEKFQPIFKSEEERLQYTIERQRVLEQDAYDAAINRWRADAEASDSLGSKVHNPAINPLLHRWLLAMVPLIKEELKHVEEAEANPGKPDNFERCQYGPYLRLLSPEKLAGITITSIIKLASGWQDSTAMKASASIISVGRNVEHEYISEQLQKAFETKAGEPEYYKKKALQKQLAEVKNEKDLAMLIYRQNRRAEMEKDGTGLLLNERWSQPVRAKVGSVLVSLLFQVAKIKVRPTNKKVLKHMDKDLAIEQPALVHGYQFVGGKKIGVIRLHDEFSKKLMTEPLKGTTLAKQLPMIAKPRPWCAWNDGAYYFTPTRMVRVKDSLEQTMYVKEASKHGNLDRLFTGLDVLGSTAWTINQKVFDVILQVWNTGDKFADIPPTFEKDVNMPEMPQPNADAAAKAAFKIAYQEMALIRKNHHSQRCDVNFKLEIARAFYNEVFYFPHNVDFRGRAYAMPPHLNHLGNDLCRGLLKFSEKKPLGESGLRWLKIHLSNLGGYDKASLIAREEWAESRMEDVFDSARDPLGGKRWWLESEDPWQMLATCMELEAAMSSKDPLKYESNMPVHQDGTCNGLQHYAALGGDIVGAKQVNLEPADKPQDVYTGVADLVNQAVAEDAQNGNELAKDLLGHINRKVVKQTVMTNVYGVTFIGAKNQVKSRLMEKGVWPRDRVDKLSIYLTKKIFTSLQSMFTGAHLIQKWFGECAKRISRSVSPTQYASFAEHYTGVIPTTGRQAHTKERGKAEFMTSVVWTTPLGLPVVQPYRHDATVAVKTNLQQITIVDTSIINQVNSRRQMGAFPPNYIHSLDATHMLLSAMASKQAGLTFAAVHDSFWTHPCDVDTMSRVLRDAFVELHSEDLVSKLREEFVLRYKKHKTLVIVPSNHPAGKEINKHRKEIAPEIEKMKLAAEGKVPTKKRTKVAITAVDDLMREIERDRLCASEDPEERARGEKMVTAGSIYRSYGLTPDHDFDKVDSAAFGEELSGGETQIELEGRLLKAENESDGNAEESLEESLETTMEASEADNGPKSAKSALKKKPKGSFGRVHVWVDLEFPPVPPKGDFDVSRLKHSKYFFS